MTSSAMSYRFEDFDGFSVIALLPDLNKAPWAEIDGIGTALLKRMEQQPKPSFLVDLDALNYMGSAMVALVVRLWKSIKERNGKMVVLNDDEMVLEVLRLAGLEKVWTIVDSRDDGLKSLGVSLKKQRAAGMTPSPIPQSSSSQRESSGTGAMLVTILLLVVAAAGLFLLIKPLEAIKDTRISLGLLFCGSLLTLVAGSATAAIGKGANRVIGVIGVLAAFGILAAGVAKEPKLKTLLTENGKKANHQAKQTPTGGGAEKSKTGKSQTKKSDSEKSQTGKSDSANSGNEMSIELESPTPEKSGQSKRGSKKGPAVARRPKRRKPKQKKSEQRKSEQKESSGKPK